MDSNQDGGKRTVRVGVTGHRFLGDEPLAAAGVDLALDRITRDFKASALTIVSSLASGADQLVAQRALARPGTGLIVPLPLPLADYLQDFESRETLRALLARATRIVELPPAVTREEAYLAAGRYVVGQCEVLIAVWDGRPARGLGGTAEVVALARRTRLPLAWVRACNWAPGAAHSGSDEDEGTVRYERFPPSTAGRQN
jgi:hypothetical protein